LRSRLELTLHRPFFKWLRAYTLSSTSFSASQHPSGCSSMVSVSTCGERCVSLATASSASSWVMESTASSRLFLM
jgi:hypothetical protein